MEGKTIDVLAVGNAIVDVIAAADDEFLAAHGMAKGGMTLIDAAAAERLYGLMRAPRRSSGGSAGNTVAGVASFGGRAAYVGKVKDDVLGRAFCDDIRALGVAFDTPAARSGPATARCLIFVTPDAQRTMNTFLGACVDIRPEDVDEAAVASAAVVYLEGYLFDAPPAMAAFRKAAQAARAAGSKVALSLSDSFCVERHRAAFKVFIADHVDILFANEAEIVALYETQAFAAAAREAGLACALAAITRGAAGSVLVAGDAWIDVAAVPVGRVVDTTGAGDLYAAGVLYGLSRGMALAECGRLGSVAAAEAVSHFGGRPERSLAQLTAPDAAVAAPAS